MNCFEPFNAKNTAGYMLVTIQSTVRIMKNEIF